LKHTATQKVNLTNFDLRLEVKVSADHGWVSRWVLTAAALEISSAPSDFAPAKPFRQVLFASFQPQSSKPSEQEVKVSLKPTVNGECQNFA